MVLLYLIRLQQELLPYFLLHFVYELFNLMVFYHIYVQLLLHDHILHQYLN